MGNEELFGVIAGILFFAILFTQTDANLWKWFLGGGVLSGAIWLKIK